MKKIISLFLALIFVSAMCFSASAIYDNTPIPTKTLNDITDDFRKALKNGETSVSVSKYKIMNDSGGKAFNYLFSSLFLMADDIMSYKTGKSTENIVIIGINGDVGSYFSEITIKYPERYLLDNGKCNLEKVAEDKKLVSSRYIEAKNIVKKSMSDLEKALALYDFIVETIAYSEPIDKLLDGSDNYSMYSYMIAGLLLDRRGVCSAYAKLYASLLNEVGVPAITVASSSMMHEWTMVCIDGEWYHCDPTWDDPIYDQGMTTYGDANQDTVDEGAVTHHYFLKSDDEIRELDHIDWEVSNTVNPDRLDKTPVSGPSGKFDGMFFDSNNTDYLTYSAMCYINGYWYFTDLKNCAVIRTQIDGSPEIIQFPVKDEFPKYSFYYNDDLYISTYKSVYRFNTFNDSFTRILDIPADKEDSSYFSEMNISFGQMTLVTVNVSADGDIPEFSFDTATYPMEELEIKAAVSDKDDEPESAEKNGDSDNKKPLYTKPVNPNKVPETSSAAGSATTTDSKVATSDSSNSSSFDPIYIIIAAGIVILVAAIIIIIIRVRR